MPESVSRRSSAAMPPDYGLRRWGLFGMRHAQLVVLRDDDLARVVTARRALRIAVHLEDPEALLQRVVGHEPADEGLAQVEEQLDGLHGLDGADDARQHAEHTGLGAARRELGR